MYVNFMLEHLVSANLYLGFHLTFRHASMVRFLMIPRSRVDIFDLSITIYSIRLALNLFQKIYITRGICWLHGYLETLLVKPIDLLQSQKYIVLVNYYVAKCK